MKFKAKIGVLESITITMNAREARDLLEDLEILINHMQFRAISRGERGHHEITGDIHRKLFPYFNEED